MQPIHLPGVEIVHADAHLRKPLQLEGDKPSITACTERRSKDSAGGESKVSPVTAPTSVGKSGDGIIITHFPPEHEPHHLIKFWRTIADYLSERQCDALQYECKLLALGLATRVPAWVVVGDGGYPSLEVALTAFERFRASNPQRRFEIRLPDNGAYATGWDVLGPFGDNVPGVIGGGDFLGLQLDGEDRWNGLRIVTPEVDVVYGEGSCYSVVIEEGLTTIEYDAFAGCTSLTSLTFPEGLTTIRDGAFSGCTGLTSLTFPEGLTTIGYKAFSGCTGLTSLTFPEGLTTIGENAFYQCTNLTSVTFPAGLTTIRGYAFYGCTGLTSLTFAEGLTTIGEYAFGRCTGLTSLTLPADDTYEYGGNGDAQYICGGAIKREAFYGCTGLASVTFPEGLTNPYTERLKMCVTFNEITAETEIPATDIQTAAEASDHFIIIRKGKKK